MKHVCLRFPFESAPPFTGSSAQCAHAFIICILPLPFACPVLNRRMNPPYFLFSGRFSLDIRALFRYDICRKQTFFLLRVFVHTPRCGRLCRVSYACGKKSAWHRFVRFGVRIPSYCSGCSAIGTASPETASLFFSCPRPCDPHSGFSALPDAGYRFRPGLAKSPPFRRFGALLKMSAAGKPCGRGQENPL